MGVLGALKTSPERLQGDNGAAASWLQHKARVRLGEVELSREHT